MSATSTWLNDDDEDDEAENAKVRDAREALKNRFTKKPTSGKGNASAATNNETPLDNSSGKEMRTWVQVSNKISKKDMEKIDVSKDKSGEIDIDRQKEIYLGGDNDVLEGFYNSDDEIDFENFKRGGKKGQN